MSKVCAIRRDGRRIQALGKWGNYAAVAIMRIKSLAPYALIELVLPGGSVMALLLWLYRRRRNGAGFGPSPAAASGERRTAIASTACARPSPRLGQSTQDGDFRLSLPGTR
jgi:hypothetical protein